jgi:hypothetical protein
VLAVPGSDLLDAVLAKRGELNSEVEAADEPPPEGRPGSRARGVGREHLFVE